MLFYNNLIDLNLYILNYHKTLFSKKYKAFLSSKIYLQTQNLF